MFYTNSSYEYWGRAASLIHTTVDSRADAPLMDTTRIYMFAGGQHGPAAFPPSRSAGQQLNNPNDYRWFMRPLLLSMHRWIKDGVEPPRSRYPRIDDKTLVPLDELRFPALPGVQRPTEFHKAYRVSYGPEFASKGIITLEPPNVTGSYRMLVPQVDEDGNELAGLRMPEIAVPLATYTGWNHFNADSGPPNLLSTGQGSYIPLPRSRAERERTKDPRLSIEERHHSRAEYLDRVSATAQALIRLGYLLEPDLAAILERAGRHWDYVLSNGDK